jgi:hypothetical protein
MGKLILANFEGGMVYRRNGMDGRTPGLKAEEADWDGFKGRDGTHDFTDGFGSCFLTLQEVKFSPNAIHLFYSPNF